MYSAFECGRLATGPDVIADRSQTDSRVLSSHDPKTGFPIDGLDRFASIGRFDLHEAHGRSPNRFADRLGVSGIVLVALDVGLHVLAGISRTRWPSFVSSRAQ